MARKLLGSMALALYLIGYGISREAHYLVNHNGHRMSFSVRHFDISGPQNSTDLVIGGICYWLFYPMHRLETLFRHGPVSMIFDR